MAETNRRTIARRFRELAEEFETVARDCRQNIASSAEESYLIRHNLLGHQKLRHAAGVLVIAAHQQRLLDLPGLDELVRFHTHTKPKPMSAAVLADSGDSAQLAKHPDPPMVSWQPSPANLVHELFGIAQTGIRESTSCPGKIEVYDQVHLEGILPKLYPEHFTLNPYYRSAESSDELMNLLSLEAKSHLQREAIGCRLLADLVEAGEAEQKPAEPTERRSAPMSKTELAKRIQNRDRAKPRDVDWGRFAAKQVSPRKWTVRTDGMDEAMRQRVDQPAP